jgi:parallel beta-helix repeat protein
MKARIRFNFGLGTLIAAGLLTGVLLMSMVPHFPSQCGIPYSKVQPQTKAVAEFPQIAGYNVIDIVGNAGWAAFRSAGNCTGGGTAGDPYVIANEVINAGSSTSGICIENTTASFVIRNCTSINSAPPSGNTPAGGILLSNVTNGLLVGNNCSANGGIGIVLWAGCSNVTVANNTAMTNVDGIAVGYSANDTVANNTAEGNTNAGILLTANSSLAQVVGNNASGNQDGIFLLYGASNSTIEGNNMTGNLNYGIEIYKNIFGELDNGSTNNTVSGNTIVGNDLSGAYLYSVQNN